MTVYQNAASNIAASVDCGVAKGRELIETCAQLDARMEGLAALAEQVRGVNDSITSLETAMGLTDGTMRGIAHEKEPHMRGRG